MLAICSLPFLSSRIDKSQGLQTLATTMCRWAAGFLSKIHTEAVYPKLGNSITISRALSELICLNRIFLKNWCLSGLSDSIILTVAHRISNFPFILPKQNNMIAVDIISYFALDTVSGCQHVDPWGGHLNKKFSSSLYQLELTIFKFVKKYALINQCVIKNHNFGGWEQ